MKSKYKVNRNNLISRYNKKLNISNEIYNSEKDNSENSENIMLKFNQSLINQYDNIDYLLNELLSRDDVKICSDNYFRYYEINYDKNGMIFRISINDDDNIDIRVEDNNLNTAFYDNVSIKIDNIFKKYKDRMFEKCIQSKKNQIDSVINKITDITKINRKIKVSKLKNI